MRNGELRHFRSAPESPEAQQVLEAIRDFLTAGLSVAPSGSQGFQPTEVARMCGFTMSGTFAVEGSGKASEVSENTLNVRFK